MINSPSRACLLTVVPSSRRTRRPPPRSQSNPRARRAASRSARAGIRWTHR
uniref:Uncharacterized protein n=1 Tax=uncultured marine virus TaxID=186617 RepID=A0A0F7LAG8_9VIRU|nr:hypothetical protein [uncultured marine virus]